MKTIKFIIVVLLFSQLIIAQDKNDIAKSYYLNAENFYSTGRYNESVSELEKSIEVLGNTNAKIQHLKVKSLLGNAENDPFDLVSLLRARYDLKLFFKLVDKNNFNKEKYDEMVSKLALIEGKIETISNDNKEYNKALVSYNESTWDSYLNSSFIKSHIHCEKIKQLKSTKSEQLYRDSSLYLTGNFLYETGNYVAAKEFYEAEIIGYIYIYYRFFNKRTYKRIEKIINNNYSNYKTIDSIIVITSQLNDLMESKNLDPQVKSIINKCIYLLSVIEYRECNQPSSSNYIKNLKVYFSPDEYYKMMARKYSWCGNNVLQEKFLDSVSTNSPALMYSKGWSKLYQNKTLEAHSIFKDIINSNATNYYKIGSNALLGNVSVIKKEFESYNIYERENLFFCLFHHYALNNKKNEAINSLEQALIYGFKDKDNLEIDQHLKQITSTKEYKELADYYFSIN